MDRGIFSQPSQDPEERAYMLLQWASRAPLAPFNAELADAGFYTRVQKERSDEALKAEEAANPFESSSELKAFRELERVGQITQAEYFSPSKAAQGIYTSTLKVYRSAQRVTSSARAEISTRADRRDSEPNVFGLARPRRGQAIDSDPGFTSDQRSTRNSSQRRTYRKARRREDQP